MGDLYAAGIDASTFRMVVGLTAVKQWILESLDVSQAFLNAILELPHKVIMMAPRLFTDAGVCSAGKGWLVERAIHGLRESPNAWCKERDSFLRTLEIDLQGIPIRLKQSITDPRLWFTQAKPVEMLKKKDLHSDTCNRCQLPWVSDTWRPHCICG